MGQYQEGTVPLPCRNAVCRGESRSCGQFENYSYRARDTIRLLGFGRGFPRHTGHAEILGVKIMRIRIPVSSGRPMSTIIESAVTNFLLLKEGLDSAKEFEERVLTQIAMNKEETE